MAKSLAAQKVEEAKEAGNELIDPKNLANQLPAVFGGGGFDLTPRFSLPYLAFSQPAAREQWQTFVRHFPDLEDGDPVMVFPEPQKPVKIDNLKLTVLAAQQYFAVRDPAGKELERHFKNGPKRAERVWAAIIVYLKDQAVPCTCLFKSTKCGCVPTITAEIEAAGKPSWMENGTNHKLAYNAMSAPFARVVGEVQIAGKTGKSSGLSFRLTKAVTRPSGPEEWALLSKVTTSQLHELAQAYSNRLEEMAIVE
jgi:hypothetical protein